MEIRSLTIAGAFEVTPRQFHDDRGTFAEGFRADRLAEALGHEMRVRQTNISVSQAGALRGIHFAALPPSQAKFVTVTSGVFLDFVIDIRVGSPTFGQWDSVRLDAVDRRAVYVAEGLGHALACLEDGVAVYLCSEVFNPAAERGVNPLDPAVGLALPEGFVPVVSDKDAAAPTLEAAAERGELPTFEQYLAHTASLAGH
ncbi:dTDP-4-dehydrorhamnose 3,5-epimerase family protein [Intrasporangium calvum]|uniref:dTDP-4-dehydrorhamnose 3,5-epimerase n=1 Tax=Intrasporangium calvum (strain ATCC 23552 / DSM 43043 / JCM 3097 / NBRC 12989 / NCIMB 10167 / NRRL B-3866 / 7 KIP) TaxID=710696 RepID=E6SET6_INTC7|nr:dTDP-4-dehydrorhamnose 3,5-epimerase family protein [Intrasporangium calvum]ADU47693.1 dTDP-4-dehydrorhamnose 3,5-epimerase [Intrasporangium calvum DSM 43043]